MGLVVLNRKIKKTLALAFLIFSPVMIKAGWIEDKDGKTVIHVKVWSLPDPTSIAPDVLAEREVLRAFTDQFPETFASKYRAQ